MTDRKNWKLGASTCILRGWENHTEGGFDLYKKADIKCAELSLAVWQGDYENLDFYENPEKLYGIAKNSGVEFTSLHAPFSADISFSHPDSGMRQMAVDKIKKAISSAAKIGIKTIVMHPSGAHYENYPDREVLIRQCVSLVGEVYAHCKGLGVTLAVENLTGKGLCGTPEEMIRLLKEYDELKVCFDTNHCTHILPEDYLDALLKAGMKGRIAAVHISDYFLKKELHLLPGEGKINWEAVLSKLEELDFNGVFMYEVTGSCIKNTLYSPQNVKVNFECLIHKRR